MAVNRIPNFITHDGERWFFVRKWLDKTKPAIEFAPESGSEKFILEATKVKTKFFKEDQVEEIQLKRLHPTEAIISRSEYYQLPAVLRIKACEQFGYACWKRINIDAVKEDLDDLRRASRAVNTPTATPLKQKAYSSAIENINADIRNLRTVVATAQGYKTKSIDGGIIEAAEKVTSLRFEDATGQTHQIIPSVYNASTRQYEEFAMADIVNNQAVNIVKIDCNQSPDSRVRILLREYDKMAVKNNLAGRVAPELLALTVDEKVALDSDDLDETISRILNGETPTLCAEREAMEARADRVAHYALADKALDEALASGSVDQEAIASRLETLKQQPASAQERVRQSRESATNNEVQR